jgi:hypothetical protein
MVLILRILKCVLVAREWPVPKSLDKLDTLKDLTGVEGFVIKLWNGEHIKFKTTWWKSQRHKWKFSP